MAHGQTQSIDSIFHTTKSEAAYMLAASIIKNGIDNPYADAQIVNQNNAFSLFDLH